MQPVALDFFKRSKKKKKKQLKQLALDQENWFKLVIWQADHTIGVSDYILDCSIMKNGAGR